MPLDSDVHLDRPLTNVVLRTRNRPLLLSRALEDICAQTSRDWIVSIINDGGDPGEVDAAVELMRDRLEGRYRVVHNPVSQGMEAAANQGVAEMPDASFVAIHDDDDTWHPSFLAATSEWLRVHEESPAVAVRTTIVWEQIERDVVSELGRETFLPWLEQVTIASLLRHNTCVPISMLYRATALSAIGGFNEALPVVGDWDANLKLAMVGPIGFISEPLANWHQRPDSSGAMGNSVVAGHDLHRHYDAVVRDAFLRDNGSSSGLGLMLIMTKYLDDRFAELTRRLEAMEDRSLASVLRRKRDQFKSIGLRGRRSK